jgi:hypothetical protein
VSSGSEGVRRLSIFVGVLGSLGWLGWAWNATDGFNTLAYWGWFVVAGGTVGWFLVPWAFVGAVAWVVRALQKDREE